MTEVVDPKTAEKKVAVPAPVPAPAPKSVTADDLLAILRDLPEAEKEKVRDLGIAVPRIAQGSDPKAFKWGYLCRNCGNLALVFVGDRWVSDDGSVSETVPFNVPFSELPWTQKVPGAKYHSPNPRHPNCMHCFQQITQGYNNSIRDGYVVLKEAFEAAKGKEHAGTRRRWRSFEKDYQQFAKIGAPEYGKLTGTNPRG